MNDIQVTSSEPSAPPAGSSRALKPRFFIPSLYFSEGLPYTVVNSMSVVLLKNLSISNEVIGLATSWLQLPWVIKALWAPLIDLKSTRRNWIVVAQMVLGVLSAALALSVLGNLGLPIILLSLLIMGFTSATQDIAIDGYYMDVLDKDQQAFYVGVRNALYKVAWLFGSGGLVYLAGALTGQGFSVRAGWGVAFAVCAGIFIVASAFHKLVLPYPQQSTPGQSVTFTEIKKVFFTFFEQPQIGAIVFYILTFRLGDAFMLKMAQPFLLDPIDKGGLAISTADVGLIYGTVGMIFLLVGGIAGGWLVSRFGLKRCLLPSAIVQNSAILFYWFLAAYKPPLAGVAAANAYEQFSYGLGVSAYTAFLLSTVKQEYRAAHYAIATALMALGVMLPGSVSGFLQGWLGYQNFFILSFVASLPGIISIFYLPLAGSPKDSPD